MTVFILSQLLVIVSSYRLASRVLRHGQAAEFLVSWGVLALAQVVAILLSLGVARALTVGNAVMLAAALCLLILAGTRRSPVMHPQFTPEKWQYAVRGNYAVLILSALLAGFFLVKLSVNLLNAPFGWDSLNYHFTFPVEWLKNGTLSTPITVGDDPSPSYYPVNGSLVYLWLMMPLRSVFLADLGQAPFFVLGFLCVYAIARRMRLSSEYSFFAAVLFTLVPNYFKQAEVAYVDVMVSSLFLAACVYLARLRERFTRADALMAGISLGLCVGTKSVALVYSVVLVVWFAVQAAKSGRWDGCVAAGLAFAAFGGFSYARNFIETGNPLYPCDVIVAGRTVFPGVIDLSTISAHMEAGKQAVVKLLFHEGMGVQTPLCALAGMLSLAAAFLSRRKRVSAGVLYILLACPALIYILYRYAVPLGNARYLYPALGLGMISGLFAARLWGVPRKLVQALAVTCGVVSAGETAGHAELVVCVAVTVVLATGLWFLHRIPRRSAGRLGYACVAAALLAVSALYPLHGWYLRNEYALYVRGTAYSGFWPPAASAWQWLNENTRGEHISYAGRPVPFPLYGTRYKNTVYYTSVNRVDPATLQEFPGSRYRWGQDFREMHDNFEEPLNYRGRAEYAVWLENLRNRKTDVLFVYALHQTDDVLFPVEDSWARSHPEVFQEVFSNTITRIYRIRNYS